MSREPIEPNDLAREAGHRFLCALEAAGLPLPNRVVDDVMGGWAFYTHRPLTPEWCYAAVFCDNEGDVVGLRVDRHQDIRDADEGIEAAVEAVRWVLSRAAPTPALPVA